jgi:hypothetical protein
MSAGSLIGAIAVKKTQNYAGLKESISFARTD